MSRGPILRGEPRPFGWCLTGHHDTCPVTVTSTDGIHANQPQTCPCDCHK